MKRFRKVYIEISNVCNLNCSFCPGTSRLPYIMQPPAFSRVLEQVAPYTDYIYFHLMGEPLCHPYLREYLQMAGEKGLKAIITTNGTLLNDKKRILLSSPGLHKVNISLHAFEANNLSVPFEEYLNDCFSFGMEAQEKFLVVYRLWNQGGADRRNQEILDTMHSFFPEPWIQSRNGSKIGNRIYLEYGDLFDWPDLSSEKPASVSFCYGLRDQLGVLCDGTVVPCCLDHNGDIPLGNLLTTPLSDILNTPRARLIYDGFSSKKAVEELCRHCGYAARFH